MDLKKNINILQEECNELYEKLGAKPEVIELQAVINNFRYKYNLVDEAEKVFKDFVQ